MSAPTVEDRVQQSILDDYEGTGSSAVTAISEALPIAGEGIVESAQVAAKKTPGLSGLRGGRAPQHEWSPSKTECEADGHHIIQDAAARGGPEIKGKPKYSYYQAPSIQLEGPSYKAGTEHYRATRVQEQRGGGTYRAEGRIGYKALRKAGKSVLEARSAILRADRYFIGELGWDLDTPTAIPKNRR